ncbi:hypothetical protein [Pontitalea aquivivens]|uniref:hypothetical protein n=1 Tax=Pontitalea aquivivens TaxID=3388663 RepID=UPI003970B901
MKRIISGLVLAVATAVPVFAGGIGFDLPRLDFPVQGETVTRACSDLVQSASCAQD